VIIGSFVKIIKFLNSNRDPGQIAAAVSFGLMLALMPSGNLLWPLILILTLFLKVNYPAELIFLAFFKTFVSLFDPSLHAIGYYILTAGIFRKPFTSMFELPLLPFTRLNNTIVMGGFVAGVILWFPVYALIKVVVRKYRGLITERLRDSGFYRIVKKIPLASKISGAMRRYGKI